MINRFSNLINRNRSAAKISQVLCSSQDTHYAKADNVVQIYFQRRSYLPRLKRSSTKEEHRISRFQLLRLWEEKIFPRDKKKYKTYNIYNRIQFLADKFALSISSNATNLFGYPYESRELKILSVVGQNVWKGRWNNQVFQAKKNTASSTTDLRLLFMVNQCKFLPASEFALRDRYLNIQIRQNGSCWTCLRTLRILGITRRWWMWFRELSRQRDFLSPPFETLTSDTLWTGDSHTWERNIMRDTLMILQAH